MRRLIEDHFYRRHRRLLLPALCWLIYIAYEQLAIFLSQGKLSPAWINLFYYSLNIGLFYTQRLVLNRLITRDKARYLLAVLFTLLCLSGFLLIKFAGNYWLFGHRKLSWREIELLALWNLYRSIYFIGLSTLFWATAHIEIFRKDAEKSRLIAARDKAQLETQLAETRSAYYQHQLNPHLLFNTLNFIYNSVDQHSPEAARGVLLLSDILRFSLSDRDPQGKVPLADEIAQLDNLVGINRLRYAGGLAVDFRCEGNFEPFRIIPLILLTLTENLFKHGLINDPLKPARLSVAIDSAGHLIYLCVNQKKRPQDGEGSGQLGLRNVRLRLDQAYGTGYSLNAGTTGETYQVELKLQL